MYIKGSEWRPKAFLLKVYWSAAFFFFFGCAGSIASRAFSLVTVCGRLIAVAPLVAEHRLWCMRAAVIATPRLRAQAQSLWRVGFVAPWRVRSSQIRDRTCVSCIGWWILYHWATRKALIWWFYSWLFGKNFYLPFLHHIIFRWGAR